MNEENGPPKSEALSALRQYLTDSIPPMIFVESIDELFTLPPQATAAEIIAWVAVQHRTPDPLPTSDYLYHAAKKLYLLGELELIPRARLDSFIKALRPMLLQSCPEEDRQSLASDLQHLREGESTLTSAVGVIHSRGPDAVVRGERTRRRDSGPEGRSGGDAVPKHVAEGLRRVNMLLERLQSVPQGTTVGDDTASQRPAFVAEIVSEAAGMAQTPEELKASLGELEQHGIPAAQTGVVRLLAQSLPNWAPPPPTVDANDETVVAPPQAAVRAMERVITMADDGGEKSNRFEELVSSAVEEFNTGSIGRAVTMLDLAERMYEKNEIDKTVANSIRNKAFSSLDIKQLRRSAESDEQHHLLRRIMSFFPRLSPDELLAELEMEENRERRRYLLALLNAHGAVTRETAVQALHDAVKGDASFPWYFERNLLYLMRTTNRQPGAELDTEIDVLVPLSELDGPLQVVREAMVALGHMDHDRAVTALVARVSELEDALLGKRELQHDEDELLSLLDSTVTSLARTESQMAWRSVASHGLKRQPQLGDTLARLARLAGQDMSSDPQLVDRMLEALRLELPRKLLGLTVKSSRRSRNAEMIIKALSGTDNEAVRTALDDIVEGYRGQPFAEAAARARARLGAAPRTERRAATTLSGDLSLFGLPNVLQNLSDSQVSGVMTVLDDSGAAIATITLDGGMVQSSQMGKLVGEEVIYQLMEYPVTGRFEFSQRDADATTATVAGAAPRPVAPLLFEGIRRYDEFKRAAALAPDGARFRGTEKKPTALGDEPDSTFLRSVWQRASSGDPPRQVENEMAVDSYRIRRLYEHWLSEGSLQADTSDKGPKEPATAATG